MVKKHKARIFVDDAHALGVIGPGGRGTAAHFGIGDQVDLMGGTFSKSLASIGGWLVGERKVLDYIQHFAQLVHVRRERGSSVRRRRHGRARRHAGRDVAHGSSCARTSPTCAKS